MNAADKLACAFLTLLCIGLALIAYGAGVLTGKFAVGFTVFGAAVSYAALRLFESIQR